jgi:erythrin-vacuolar iron transport family protein
MAFAEALSDDGSLTGPGPAYPARLRHRADDNGWRNRSHAPFPHSGFPRRCDFRAVVGVELAAISYIRHRYMDTPLLSAAFQVVLD